jgi:DNA-binding IclR family transcriptional regulator
MKADKRTTVKSARRTLDILELLTAVESTLTFAEIGRALGLPVSSLSGLLHTLVDAGWLEFDRGSRAYGLGLRALEAGNSYARSRTLIDRATPVMTRIRDEIEETVQMAVRDGRHVVYIAKVDGQQALTLASEVGRRLPAHATGLGKVLLAGLPSNAVLALYRGVQLERLTDQTITDVGALIKVLADVRRKGWGHDDGEYTGGVRCVAAPIFDQTGTTAAALSVAAPQFRFNPKKRKQALSLLIEGAGQVSASNGYVTPQ